jgi:hypothetical protein
MKNFLAKSLFALIILILAGCNNATPTPTTQLPEHFPQTAEETAGNIINGLAKQDYEIFSKNFDPKMKAAIPPAAVIEVQKLLWNQNGEFQTIQTKSVFEEKGYFIGIFNLSFAKGQITMRIVFSPTEPYQVSGLWFPTN